MSPLNPFSHPGLLIVLIAIYTAVFTAWGLTLEYTGRAWDALPDWLADMDKTSARRLVFAANLAWWLGVYHLVKWASS